MEKILNQILSEMQSMNKRFDGVDAKLDKLESCMENMESRMENMESRIETIDSTVKEIDRKTTIIFNQTADLTEFKTSVNEKLDALTEEVAFISHREYETEKDVYAIKRHLQIVK